MTYCRYQSTSGPRYGQIELRNGQPWLIADILSPFQFAPFQSPPFEPARPADPNPETYPDPNPPTPVPLASLTLLPPVQPSKILCVGRNYRDHAKELGNEVPTEPLLFFKPPSSLLAPGATIRLPRASTRVDFEGELAIIIAQRARRLDRHQDLTPFIHGITLANDVTARDLQKKDGQWARAKGFDTFCPLGPIVRTDLDPLSPLTIETHLNGELRQHGSTADFLFSLPILLEYITAAFTLEPGDLILTGTPAGVGPLAAGDTVSISIPELGTLSNPVQNDEA